MKIFAGTSNKPLAQKIADSLDVPLGNVEITRFIDNECRVFVQEEVSGENVYVVQSLSEVADQHLVELCLIGSSLRDLGAKSITAVIPWMGYSKQDKAFRRGEAVSAQLVARFIQAAGFDRVVTCELHSENVVPYFSIPVEEVTTHTLLLETLKKEIEKDWSRAVVASPDKGGKSRSEEFAKEIGLPIVYLDKSRDVQTGEVTVTGISGDVKDHDVIIFDDIINTASTAIETAKFLKANGARSICFLATHPVLAGAAVQALEKSVIDRVILTDTIVQDLSSKQPKFSVVSVAPLLAHAIAS